MSTIKRGREPKSLQMSFRFSERARAVMEVVSAHQNRSFANVLEVALFAYAEATGVTVPAAKGKTVKKKAAKKKAAKR